MSTSTCCLDKRQGTCPLAMEKELANLELSGMPIKIIIIITITKKYKRKMYGHNHFKSPPENVYNPIKHKMETNCLTVDISYKQRTNVPVLVAGLHFRKLNMNTFELYKQFLCSFYPQSEPLDLPINKTFSHFPETSKISD